MPDQTGRAIPYPLPDDAVTDYPALGQDLAETLDALLQADADARRPALYSFMSSVYVNGASATPSAYLAGVVLPAGAWIIEASLGVTWQNTAGVEVAIDHVGVARLFDLTLNHQADGLALPPLYVTSAAALTLYLMGYDHSTINQADWGTTFSRRVLLATPVPAGGVGSLPPQPIPAGVE